MKIDQKLTWFPYDTPYMLSIFVFQNNVKCSRGILKQGNEIETQCNETKRKIVKRKAIKTKRNEIESKLVQMQSGEYR